MKIKIREKVIFFSFIVLILFIKPLLANVSTKDESDQEEIKRNHFPDLFFFGTSTSAYQIEGGYFEDGRSLSIWDVFSHTNGNINNNDNGDIADDHYHRYMGDIELIQSLGVNAYRFSISWNRILPRGKYGSVNPKGVMFYNKIIDNLLLRGIEPFVTIYHYDLPQILEDKYKGWLSPLIREDFVHFATICFKEFGDRVKYWVTLNEPAVMALKGYLWGTYPPTRCSQPFGECSAGDSDKEPLIAMHNMLISHAMAANVYRNHFQIKQGGYIGIVVDIIMYEPLREELKEDQEAVNRALAFNLAWALDPLIYGEYPKEMRECIGLEQLPRFSQREKELLLRGSIDFIGLNHYSTQYAKDCLRSACSAANNRPIRGFVETTGERDGVPIGELTGLDGFYVVPRGMEMSIDYIKQRYNNNKPIIVTENGFASPLNQNSQEQLQDLDRINFHKSYLSAIASAIRNGANVRGYFIWSLMDNFEWLYGYGINFGIYQVDRATLNRTPKLSAKWFANFLTNFTTNHSHNNKQGFEEGTSLSSLTRTTNATMFMAI